MQNCKLLEPAMSNMQVLKFYFPVKESTIVRSLTRATSQNNKNTQLKYLNHTQKYKHTLPSNINTNT